MLRKRLIMSLSLQETVIFHLHLQETVRGMREGNPSAVIFSAAVTTLYPHTRRQ